MDKFEFLATLLSIIIGISISRLLEELTQLFRKKGQLYLPYIIAWVLLLILQIQHWWATFTDAEILGNVNFGQFIIYLLPFISLVVAVDMFIPDNNQDSIRKHYWENGKRFFTAIAVYLLLVMFTELFYSTRYQFQTPSSSLLRFCGVIAVLGLAYFNDEKYEKLHVVVLIVTGVLLAIFIMLVTPNL